MTGTSLRLVAHGVTPALRRAVFGADDELDEGGLRAALVLAGPGGHGRLGRPDTCLSSPARPALQTARAAGHLPAPRAELADWDYGAWTGRAFAEIAAVQPEAVRRWLTEPDAAPHGGESLAALIARVGRWLDREAGAGGRVLAVTHAAVIRAALVSVLRAPAAAFWQLDVAPLSVTRLRWRDRGWTLHLPAAP